MTHSDSAPKKRKTVKQAASSAIAYSFSLRTAIMELFDIGPWVAFSVLIVAVGILIAAVVSFVKSAPPRTLTISSGDPDSMTYKSAQKYAASLAKNGIQVKVLPSNGSVENLTRLLDPKSKVDIGIIQSGATSTEKGQAQNPRYDDLVSLGSISYQPLLIFYRGPAVEKLSAFKGKRIAIGPEGSGTHKIALAVLAANGIKEDGPTKLLSLDEDDAAKLLEGKKIEAAFAMGESASGRILRSLMRSDDVKLFSFKQASAYARKFEFLNVLELPEGSVDLGEDIPAHDITLMGPMVELIAKKDIHPALVDLLIEAATEVHGRPGIFQKRGEFPAPIEHSIRMSEDANVYYKSGKSYLYRLLPFWLASLLSRFFVVLLPTLIVLIPTVRAVPAFFRWMAQLRIRRRYRELRILEQNFLHETDAAKKTELRQEFDRIEDGVNRMKVRASFADQFYGLRGHIDYVRRIIDARTR